MADPNNRQPENATDKWYVDKECVPCTLCLEEAPDLLVLQGDGDDGHAYFKKQPETPEELEQATDALEICPSEAIGNDG